MMNLKQIAATGLIAIAASPAWAVLVSDAGAMPGTTHVVDFEAFDGLLTSGPVNLSASPLLVFTGDSAAELGANARDLGDNGLWGAGKLFAAGGVGGELRFTFADGMSTAGIGAFVNHYAFDGLPFSLSIEVSAYGANNQIIETHSVTIDTDAAGYNAGQFVGIVRPEADIRSLAFKGVGVVADDLVFTSPVPEPATWMLLAAGGLMVGRLSRRRRPG